MHYVVLNQIHVIALLTKKRERHREAGRNKEREEGEKEREWEGEREG